MRRIRRLTALAALALTTVGLAAAVPTPAPATGRTGSSPLRLTLPAPTGPDQIGTVSLHLVDRSRPDPWAGPGRHRELMISLWYPARHVQGHPRVGWLPPGAAAEVLTEEGIPPGTVTLPMTHGHDGAPVLRGRLPVVLYSPGNNSTRAGNTIVVEQLASHGYLVVTVDHTYDGVVEFPDGRVVTRRLDGPSPDETYSLRAADARFVLHTIAALNAGRNPDAEHRSLPAGLTGAFDLRSLGMFGVSAGGATTASAMFSDHRIVAGLSLDGPVNGPVVARGLDRPFMLIEARINRRDYPDLAEFWSHLRGWHLNLKVTGAKHSSYGDDEALVPQVAALLGLDVVDEIGELNPARGIAVQQSYPLAFFDLHLRHRGHLLDGPSVDYPEVQIIP